MSEQQPEWAKRIERKLDALLEALEAEDLGEEPEAVDLEGNALPRERDQSVPL